MMTCDPKCTLLIRIGGSKPKLIGYMGVSLLPHTALKPRCAHNHHMCRMSPHQSCIHFCVKCGDMMHSTLQETLQETQFYRTSLSGKLSYGV